MAFPTLCGGNDAGVKPAQLMFHDKQTGSLVPWRRAAVFLCGKAEKNKVHPSFGLAARGLPDQTMPQNWAG
jgi:hypothetical protein